MSPRARRRRWSARAIVFSSDSSVLSRGPPEREGHEELAVGQEHEALARVLGGGGVHAVEEEQEFVAAHPHRGFLGARRAHQKACDPVQDGIARLVPELVVVLLEMVDVDHDAAPRAAGVGVAPGELGEIAPVPAARERVAQALVEKAFFETLAIRDVDQDALVVDLSRLVVDAAVSRVDDGPDLAVHPPDLELEIADGAVALEDEALGLAARRVHDEIGALHLPGVLERRDPEHREEGRVAVHDPAGFVRDVDPLAEIAHKASQRLGVVETGEPTGHGRWIL